MFKIFIKDHNKSFLKVLVLDLLVILAPLLLQRGEIALYDKILLIQLLLTKCSGNHLFPKVDFHLSFLHVLNKHAIFGFDDYPNCFPG